MLEKPQRNFERVISKLSAEIAVLQRQIVAKVEKQLHAYDTVCDWQPQAQEQAQAQAQAQVQAQAQAQAQVQARAQAQKSRGVGNQAIFTWVESRVACGTRLWTRSRRISSARISRAVL